MSISNTITHGIVLTTAGTYASPLTITSTGEVVATTGAAIYGPNTQAWTVANFGTIQGASTGIFLADGGAVSNGGSAATAALITGGHGIQVTGALGTVTNAATITGVGASGYAIWLHAGGTVANGASAVTTALLAGGTGIRVQGTAGTVTNAGTIAGTAGSSSGISLEAGGAVANGVSGATAALISGVLAGVRSTGAAATVSNAGTIVATNSNGIGVNLYSGGGSVANGVSGATAALISGNNGGIYVKGLPGTVSNAGTIIAATGRGIYLGGGGSVANGVSGATAALISGGVRAIYIQNAAGTVANAGTITGGGGSSSGVWLNHGGSLTNGFGGAAAALITGGSAAILLNGAAGTVANYGSVIATGSGGKGVVFSGSFDDTLTNAGTIVGSSANAVLFAGGNDRLIVDPGAVFVGNVDGGAGTNTIELAVGSAAAGLLRGIGPTVTNFSTLQFDGGAKWTAEGSAAGFPGAITGFAAGDTIDIDGFVAVGDSYNGSGLVLKDALNNSVTLGIQGSFSTSDFTIAGDTHGGTNVTINAVCFCRGTLILTARGEVAVEDLVVGDRVETLSGALKPIRWIGMGRDLVTRANKLARPVIVRAGALADGVPTRDLYLTHGHALYLESAVGGVLIPVENLVNHRSILWDEAARVVEYYHLELAEHDVLWANGAAAESYYDADNRALFHNTRPGSEPAGAKPTFAPVLNGGEVVDRVWTALFEHAGGRIDTDTTEDPDLHLVVAGARLDPASVEGCTYIFALTAPPAGTLRLCSISSVPSLLGLTAHDHRRLGVAINRIAISQSRITTSIEPDAPLFLAGGCHPAERGYCWTDGELDLPAQLFAHLNGPFTLTVRTERPGMRYPLTALRATAPRATAA